MKKQQINIKKGVSIFSIILILILGISIILYNIVYQEYNSQKNISQETINKYDTVVFYKDDCSDCKKIIPKQIMFNIFTRNTLFINLNQETNRIYIEEFSLKEVPTFAYRKGDSNEWKIKTSD